MTTDAASVLIVFGTRPEAIKLAPVICALNHDARLTPIVVVTGQHQDMPDQVLCAFGIKPDVDLKLHTTGNTLDQITTRALVGLSPVISEAQPAAVLVQGDTTSTLAAALAAFYARRPLIHLEAGLRTGDLSNPYPEEANRRLVTQLASLHLCATPANKKNLLREGVVSTNIAVTGNTVIDALLTASTWNHPWSDPQLAAAIPLSRARGDRPTVLITAHRRESWGEPLCRIAQAIAIIAHVRPDVQFIWPLHPNPAVRNWVQPCVEELNNVIVTGPATYPDFVRLMTISDLVVTDSGGVQEEAPALGVPVIVARDVTERHEAVDAGAAILVGTRQEEITAQVTALIDSPSRRTAMTICGSPYGDGYATERAIAAIAALLDVGTRCPDFVPNYVHERGFPRN